MRALAIAVLPILASCAFGDSVPPGATVLCVRADDCSAGASCDLASHTCIAAGVKPPKLTSVSFDPSITQGGSVTLQIEANAALSTSAPPTIAIVDGTLALGAPAIDGSTARFVVDAGALPEGAYRVVRVTLTAASGASSTTDVEDATLVVDRTPPQLYNAALVDEPPDGIYADVDGRNTVTVSFFASEPLAPDGVALHLGALSSSDCTATGLLGETCSLFIPAGAIADGPGTLEIDARDGAGNAATVELPLLLDGSPPGIVVDSVLVDVETAGITTSTARSDSSIRVTFVATENLGAPPTLALEVEGAPRPMTLVDQIGRRYEFLRDDASPVPPGTWPLVVALVDAFGHASGAITLPLPAPFSDGISFAGDGDLCPRPPGVTCVDIDGDGAFAIASCIDGTDPDDLDPTVYPGAIDIPGDGKDNDGIAGDFPVDETTGVFVDSEAGDDAAAGTRAAPLRTLDAAAQVRHANNLSFDFLAARATPYGGLANVDGSLAGGLDPATWARIPSAYSTVTPTIVTANALITGIDASGGMVLINGTAVDVRATLITVGNQDVIIDAVADGAQVLAEGSARFIHVNFGTLEIDAIASLERSVVQDGLILNGDFRTASFTATNSVLQGSSRPAIDLEEGFSADLYHSTVIELAASATPAIFYSSLTINVGELKIVGCSLVSVNAAHVLSEIEPGVLTLVDNNLSGADVVLDTTNAGDVPDVNACADCVRSEGNTRFDAPPVTHLTSASPLRDQGVVATDEGAPTSVVADIDLECRYADGSADVGADEFH